MFKNRYGMIRAGWKIIAVCAITILLQLILITIITSLDIYNRADSCVQDIVLSLVQCISYMVVPLVLYRKVYRQPLAEIGMVNPCRHFNALILGMTIGTFSMLMLVILVIAFGGVDIITWSSELSFDLLSELFVFIMVGIGEEIFFRGYIIGELRRTHNEPIIVLIASCLIFASGHTCNSDVSLLALLNLTIFGFITAYTYIRTGNIMMAIGFHIAWNYCQTILGFSVSGNEFKSLIEISLSDRTIVNGGGFGTEGGICATIVLLLTSIGLWVHYDYYHRGKNNTRY